MRGRRRGERQRRWKSVHGVLAFKGLHYLRVKGFAALLLIPSVSASVPHLQIANKLLLTAPQLPLRPVQEWRVSQCMTSGSVGPWLGWHFFPALPSCAF